MHRGRSAGGIVARRGRRAGRIGRADYVGRRLVVHRDHPSEPADMGWRGSGTVLVVDDEETVCDIAGQMVREAGFAILTARDGVEAVQVYRQHHQKIVCVLLDLTMPRMDGVETLGELRRIRPDACIVLTSGYSQEDSSEYFASLGLTGFIQKPYEREAILDTLRKAVGGIEKQLA